MVELNKKYFEQRRASLEIAYNNMKGTWQDLADYYLPRSVRFISRNVNKTPQTNKKIKDSTPLRAVRDFSSGMMTGATNPATNWFRIKIRDYDIKYDYPVKQWCATVEEIMRNIYNSSNLYKKLPSMYKQLGVFAIAVLSLEYDEDTILRTKLLPLGSYRIGRNEKGEVDSIARVYMESAKNLYNFFGKENVSSSVLNAVKNQNYEELFEIVHFVEPNKEYFPSSPWGKNKKYISVYYEVSGEDNKLLSKSGFDKFPYAVFETETNGEDVYPTEGCGINALPDVKQLMVMVVDEGKIIKKISSPQLKGSPDLKNQKLIDAPATFTPIETNGTLEPVYQVPPQIIQPLELLLETKRNAIKEMFYNDLFAMILNTSERGRTATEVNELKEEKMVLLSPLLEQIHSGLKKIFEWVFNTAWEKGLIPPPPEQIQGGELDIEFVSMLAQAQKAIKISGMERFATFTINLAKSLDPTLTMKLNASKIVDDYADYINVNPEQLISTEKFEKIKLALEQKQQQEEQFKQLEQSSQMIKNVAGVDSKGSELLERFGL